MSDKLNPMVVLVCVTLMSGLFTSSISATIMQKGEVGYPTMVPSDMTPPAVIENTPTGENVPVSTKVTITFSEPMNKESVEYGFSIYGKQFRVSGEFSWKENTMTFTPSSNLDYGTNYIVGLYEAWDLASNSLYEYYWNFTTEPPNNSPGMPNRPSGPDSGYIETSYSYSTTTNDPDGDDMKYVFDWGDGTTSETEFVKSGETIVQSHAWNEPGEYHIRVNATDDSDAGSKWSESLMMVARTPELISPTAIISAAPTEINEGERVSFGAKESSDPDGDIVYYDWDFGDGDTGAGVDVEHTYSRSGNYTVTLTVTDNDNLSATDTVVITVEPASVLAISISTDPVPSGESDEITVRVTSNGDPVPDASVYLSATIGDLDPGEGVTDDDGEFATIFTAPTVEAEETYTIHAEAEIAGLRGEGSVSDLITVMPNILPVAYIEIYPNPVEEGENVTFEGWGEDEDGEVVECRWTFPDGRTFSESGSSSWETLDPEDVQAGWYSFAVMDDDEIWSEEMRLELRIAPPPTPLASPTSTPIKFDPFSRILEHISDPVILVVVAALTAITVSIHIFKGKKPPKSEIEEEKKPKSDEKEEQQYGSISATSDPDDAMIFLDGIYKGKSQLTINNILIGPHLVGFVKSGYLGCERAVVNANQTTHVHCDLIEIPEIKLELASKPTKIPADGKSESIITIAIEDKDGRPIPVPKETTIVLETDIGVIDTPVKIPAGCSSTTSTLTSSTSSGTATVNAEFEKVSKLKNSITVEFLKVESG